VVKNGAPFVRTGQVSQSAAEMNVALAELAGFTAQAVVGGIIHGHWNTRRAASMRVASIFFIDIVASKARLASAPPAARASVSTRGVICHDTPQRSLHQPHALSWSPLVPAAPCCSGSPDQDRHARIIIVDRRRWCALAHHDTPISRSFYISHRNTLTRTTPHHLVESVA
jgi:hypothetical protein